MAKRVSRRPKRSHTAIQGVVQQEPTGCGIAAVAAIAGLSYARAKAIGGAMGISAQDQRLWSQTAPVRQMLTRLGVTVGRRQTFREWQSLPDLALLAIKWHLEKGRPYWHWVVFVRDHNGPRVLDSKRALRRHLRTDFGRIKPKWFIAVVPRNEPLNRRPATAVVRV